MTSLSDPARDLSVVIPTLNAAMGLPAALATIAGVAETIVADGDSADTTVALARHHGAKVVTAPRGRGTQIAAGIAAATRLWLLILHADTRLSPDWWSAAAAHMSRHPGQAGYFRFALDSDDPRARRLERWVAWRCRVLGLPYGDQGLLIRQDLLAAVGGVAPIPLMEDVELIRRLGRRNLRLLSASALTSAKRWERDGYVRRSARNILCLLLWFAGVPPTVIRRLYA